MHEVFQDVFELLGVVRQGVLELVQAAEIIDLAVVAFVVEDFDDGMIAGIVRREFLQEFQILAVVGDQGQVHGLDLRVVHAERYRAQRPVQFADVIALIDLLNGERIVVGVDAFRLVGGFDDGSLRGQFLHLRHRFHEQVVLTRHLQTHARIRNVSRVVDHETFVLVGHLLGYGDVGDAHLGNLVVSEDFAVLFLFGRDLFMDCSDLFVVFVAAYEVHPERDDRKLPFPNVALFELYLAKVFLQIADLLLDRFFLTDDAFRGLFVVIE